MARKTTEPIRLTPTIVDWLQSIQKSVQAAGIAKPNPSYSAIFDVMRSYQDRQVIVDALVDLYKAPEEHQVKASIAKAKQVKKR